MKPRAVPTDIEAKIIEMASSVSGTTALDVKECLGCSRAMVVHYLRSMCDRHKLVWTEEKQYRSVGTFMAKTSSHKSSPRQVNESLRTVKVYRPAIKN